MAGSCPPCAARKKLEDELTAFGMNLMNPPSSSDELFKLLEKVESLLKMVGQHPFDSTRSALQPVMKALVRNELLRHTNEDVKVSVVSCITEISRIFAPKYPYDDHKQMEEILQQTVMTLKKLSDVTGRSYPKVVRILEIFAKVRVCVVLLDLENETLVIEIFKLFLEVIRPYHPHNVFTWMKEIMTRLIEGSDELSVELLRPLLDSLKIDNQMASPVASKLGEKVIKDSAGIVKPYFAEALKSMTLNSDDYAEIAALLCNEMPKGEQMMAIENAPHTVHRVKIGPSEAKFSEPALQDDTHREKLKDICRTNIMKPDNPEDVQPATNVPKENQEWTGSHKITGHPVKVGPSEAKFCEPALQDDTHWEKLKDTCTTNIMKPNNPEDVQPATNVPKENQEGTGSHKLTGSTAHHSLVSENHNNSTGSHGHLCQPKRKEIPINEDDELVVLIPIRDMPQSQIQKKDSLHLGLTWGERTTRTLCAKRKPGRDSRKNGSASDCDADRKSESSIKNEEGNIKEHKEPSLQQIDGMKQKKRKKTTTKMHNIEESGDKVDKKYSSATKLSVKDENHLNKCANYKSGRNLTTRKHEDSKRACTSKDHGAELIGTKIKVWWPLEQVFYEGVISSFDSDTNKHKVIYDDGEVEKLRLHKERWEMLEDNLSQKVDARREKLKDICTTNIMKHENPEDVQPATNAEVVSRSSNKLTGDVPQYQVKKKGSLQLGLTRGERTKHTVCAKRKPRKGSRKNESASNCNAESKSEFSLKSEEGKIIENEELPTQRIDEMKQKKKKITTKMHNIEESGDKDSKRPCTIKDYGKELVGARIKVWWPLDEKFYEGVVSSFNPMKRKHKVVYDDGQVEKLRLHKERWEMLEDNSSQKDHGLDFQGHAVSSATSSKKKAKRNSSTGPNISSSKRS